MQEALALPREALAQFRAEDAHPPQVVRVFLCGGILRSMGFTTDAERLEQRQLAIYGPMPQFEALLAALPAITMPVTTMPFQALHRRSLVDLLTPFSYADQRAVETAAQALLEGNAPPPMRPVLVACAARWAFEQVTGPEQTDRLAEAAITALFEARPAEPVELADEVIEQFLRRIQPVPPSPSERMEEAPEPAQTIAGALTITAGLMLLFGAIETEDWSNDSVIDLIDDDWWWWVIALGLAVIGIVATSAYQSERILVMKPGDRTEIAGYDSTFRGSAPQRGPNYREEAGFIEVSRDGRPVAELTPSKRLFDAPRQATTEAAIHPSWRGDLYAVLGDEQTAAPGSYAVRLYFNPLVRLIWIGAIVMFAGGLLSLTDRRLRVGAPQRARLRARQVPAE